MGLDIRVPLGLIFLIIGGILAAFGLYSQHDHALYASAMGVNLNLWWGSAMFLFGLVMFLIGKRQKWQDDPVSPRPWERNGTTGRKH